MRRRLKAKQARSDKKPVDPAWLTTCVILTAAFLWYLLHWYSMVSYGCEAVIAWLFDGEQFGSAILQWSSLFTITLALWLYVDIIRPKIERIPVWIRAGQASLVVMMVVISVFQWGFYRPQSDEGRIYAYFEDEMSHWPVINWVTGAAWVELVEVGNGLTEQDLQDPVFEKAITLEAAYRRDFSQSFIPRWFGREGGRYNGRLECTAWREVNKAWERAFDLYYRAEKEDEAAESPAPSIWDEGN